MPSPKKQASYWNSVAPADNPLLITNSVEEALQLSN